MIQAKNRSATLLGEPLFFVATNLSPINFQPPSELKAGEFDTAADLRHAMKVRNRSRLRFFPAKPKSLVGNAGSRLQQL